MKILIVCGEFFNKSNGLSVSTQRFVKEFMRQGQQVRVLADDRGGKADYTVPVIHVPFFNGIMEAQNYFFADPRAAEEDLLQHLKGEECRTVLETELNGHKVYGHRGPGGF